MSSHTEGYVQDDALPDILLQGARTLGVFLAVAAANIALFGILALGLRVSRTLADLNIAPIALVSLMTSALVLFVVGLLVLFVVGLVFILERDDRIIAPALSVGFLQIVAFLVFALLRGSMTPTGMDILAFLAGPMGVFFLIYRYWSYRKRRSELVLGHTARLQELLHLATESRTMRELGPAQRMVTQVREELLVLVRDFALELETPSVGLFFELKKIKPKRMHRLEGLRDVAILSLGDWGDTDRALERLQEAIRIFRDIGAERVAAETEKLMAELLATNDQAERS